MEFIYLFTIDSFQMNDECSKQYAHKPSSKVDTHAHTDCTIHVIN